MKPYVIFGEITCGKTLSQFMDAMKQPFVERGALMPDAHAGYSLPIGAVVMTKDAVVPAWVGYDIGCGVTSSRLSLRASELKEFDLESLHKMILERVPVGPHIHQQASPSLFLNHKLSGLNHPYMNKLFDDKANRAMGTLGGGNHFIEIGEDDADNLYITVHSGSRGFGHAVASYHMAKAAKSDKAVEGHHAYTNQEEINAYLSDVVFCQWYAQLNRYRLIGLTVEAINTLTGRINTREVIANCVHNTVATAHYGCYIHRKGATEATLGQRLLIPANMRDGVYLCSGKGNVDSLASSSHGCGRALSRRQAKDTLSQDDFAKQMEGIVCNLEGKVDEAPDAYKNASYVMESQKDCVRVECIIKPVLNVKG